MSKPCRCPQRAAIKEQRAHKKQQEQALRKEQREAGLIPRRPAPLPNRCSAYATIAEEQQAREAAVSGQLRVLRRELPALLTRLQQIPDPRQPKKCRHRLTVLLLYGLLMFVFQFASRRAVNRELTCPQFEANLRLLFPELETLPHADTLFRLLRDIDVTHLEQAHLDLVRRLIRAKTFRRYLVLKDHDLSTVWEEFHALHALQPNGCQCHWGERRQRFSWVNAIDYAFSDHGRRHLGVHVVVCEETWETINEQGARLTTTARHAWLSSQPLSRDNVHERCNLGARHRWGIEAGFLVEKHQGYHYEHAFALDWNAMKGYHYLMRLAHLFNTLARYAHHLRDLYRQLGVRGALAFIRASCAGPWFDPARMRHLLAQPLQLQLE